MSTEQPLRHAVTERLDIHLHTTNPKDGRYSQLLSNRNMQPPNHRYRNQNQDNITHCVRKSSREIQSCPINAMVPSP